MLAAPFAPEMPMHAYPVAGADGANATSGMIPCCMPCAVAHPCAAGWVAVGERRAVAVVTTEPVGVPEPLVGTDERPRRSDSDASKSATSSSVDIAAIT